MEASERKIVITRNQGRLICVSMIGERLYDAVVVAEAAGPQVGDVCLGRVQKVVDNIRAAFVEIAPGVRGYLRLTGDMRKTVKAEQELIIQVKKPPKGGKDAVISTDIELVGRYVILSNAPAADIRISAKIHDEPAIDRLRSLAEGWRQETEADENTAKPSVMLRTNAGQAQDDLITAEYRILFEKWRDIRDYGRQRTLYSVLYREPAVYIRLINSFRTGQIDRILTDQMDCLEDLRSRFDEIPVEEYTDESYPLDARFSITTTLKKASERLVWLKSGANLIIDRTEAMTVIDVNTAKAVDGKRAQETTFFKVNREAADEIARQLRLRNLSGIILVDFIDMKEKEHEDALISHLRSVLKDDPVKAVYVDMTKLGIVEITRQKRFPELEEATKDGFFA